MNTATWIFIPTPARRAGLQPRVCTGPRIP